MGKMAKEEKVIIKDFQKISKQMEPKPKYFKNIFIYQKDNIKFIKLN